MLGYRYGQNRNNGMLHYNAISGFRKKTISANILKHQRKQLHTKKTAENDDEILKGKLTNLKHSSSSTNARSEGSPTILDIPAAVKEHHILRAMSS